MSSQNEKAQSDLKPFSYFISHKGPILVATLSGLCESDAEILLRQCKAEIEDRLSESVHGVVLNFSGVTGIANDLVPLWAQLQGMIRSRKVELRICGIENNLKGKLTKLGVLRATETTRTLKDAIPDIVGAMKIRSRTAHKKVS